MRWLDLEIYTSANHPEKRRLVFDTKLRQQIDDISKNREIQMLSDKFQTPHEARHPEVNGWDLERKMIRLMEMRDLIEKPFFLYSNWQNDYTHLQESKLFKIEHSYFNKVLPLEEGQRTLLDLWEYLMDMCDLVPLRNRCRSLYLHLAIAISHRIEFVRDYTIDNDPVQVDLQVEIRYYKLLTRCLEYCATKLYKNLSLSTEHRDFICQMYALAYFRIPVLTTPLLNAVIDNTFILEHHIKRPMSERSKKLQHRSPRAISRLWSFHEDNDQIPEENSSIDECKQKALRSFINYKAHLETDNFTKNGIYKNCCVKALHNVDNSLELAFQIGMCSSNNDEACIIHSPLLYSAGINQERAFKAELAHPDDLLQLLDPFIQKLKGPTGDILVRFSFISAILCQAERYVLMRDQSSLPWHCIPGYFAMIRLCITILKLVCRRRPSSCSNTTKTQTFKSAAAGAFVAYCSSHDIDIIIRGMSELFKNEFLLTPFVQVVLEGTNLHDLQSVDYSFSILQRMIETAATSCNPKLGVSKRAVPASFDTSYLLQAIRRSLRSAHAQVLLKILAFLYNCVDFLSLSARKELLCDVILRENFFRLFLHWNEEVRKLFSYILVFKSVHASRMKLPIYSDRILLRNSPFFNSPSSMPSVPVRNPGYYWSHVTDLTQTVMRKHSYGAEEMSKKEETCSDSLRKLMQWDPCQHKETLTLTKDISDEALSVDLSVVSKLDTMLKMVGDQTARRLRREDAYFGAELEAYATKGSSQYTALLWEYYETALKNPSAIPIPPQLAFTITPMYSKE